MHRPLRPLSASLRALTGVALALSAGLLGGGCANVEAPVEAEGIRESSASQVGEVVYIRNAEEVFNLFTEGEARLAPDQTFRVVDLMITTPEGQAEGAPSGLEWRARRPDGAWSEWAPVPDEGEGRFRRAVLEFADPAAEFALRNPQRIDFARLEFFGEAAPEHDHGGFDDDPIHMESAEDETWQADPGLVDKAARAGRWSLPAAVRSAGDRQRVGYTGAPAWNRGRNCTGRLLPGTNELGNHLVRQFAGARYFQGYACRQIGGSSSMSVHGTGRALDVFIPLDRGQADNDKGDPVANWLVQNAQHIGIQLIIWDRTIWTANRAAGTKDRSYGGEHPHHDHLHIELTPDGANRRTPFFTGGGSATPVDDAPAPAAGNRACDSATLGRAVPHGQCVQTSYDSCGGTCNWSRCNNGAWTCSEPSACSVSHGNATCGGRPAQQPAQPAARASCASQTLGRNVPDGQCVQMSYNSCGGTCRYARCDDGGWTCTSELGTCSEQIDHAQCGGAPAASGPSCYSRTMGRNMAAGAFVQMSYSACGGTCRYAQCDGGEWICRTPDGSGQSFPHARCN